MGSPRKTKRFVGSSPATRLLAPSDPLGPNGEAGWHIRETVRALRAGGVVAYPTEAVFGIGCDPFDPGAVSRLLAMKGRPQDKGLILIAAAIDQLCPLFAPLGDRVRRRLLDRWPGPVTWTVPADPGLPRWLTGRHHTVAVRVTAHPLAGALCRAYGKPVVSTSANRTGARPARSALEVRRKFGDSIDYILPGDVGGNRRPSEIRDALTDQLIRYGGGAAR